MWLLDFTVSEFVIQKLIRKNNTRNQVITGICYLHTGTSDATTSDFMLLPVHIGSAVLYLE